MVFWRVQFSDLSMGYQVMDEGLYLIGIFDDRGKELFAVGDYTTTDSGAEPHVGVSAPDWGAAINAR